MSNKKIILKDISLYAFGTYLTHLIDFVISVLMKRFLGPMLSGVWTSLQVILIYAKYANLGTVEASLKEIPYHIGKNDLKRAEEIKNTVFWYVLFNALLVSSVILIAALCLKSFVSPAVFWGLITISCLNVIQRVYFFQVVLLRAFKKFYLASKVMIFSSVIGIGPMLFLTWHYKIYGFYAATIFIFAMNSLYVFWKSKQRFAFTFSWSKIKPLIIVGFPIMVLMGLDIVFRSIDRIIIPRFLDFEQMGYYSLAVMAMNYLTSFPNMLNVVLFPHFQEKFSQRDNAKDLRNYVYQSTLSLAYLLPVLLAAVWFFSETIVELVLPDFRPGIFPLKILMAGVFFVSLNYPFLTLLITIKKHFVMIPVVLGLMIFASVFCIWSLQLGYGIPGVAIIMSIHYFIYFMILFRHGTRDIMQRKDSFRLFARILGIFCYFISLLLAIEILMPMPTNSVIIKNLLQFGIFTLCFSPCLILFNKETQLLKHLLGLFKDKITNK